MAIDWGKQTMYLARIKREATFFFVQDEKSKVHADRAAEHLFNEEEMGDGKVETFLVTSAEHLQQLKARLDLTSCMTGDDAEPEVDVDEAFAAIAAAKQPKAPEVVKAKAMRIETYDVEKAVGRHGEPLLLLHRSGNEAREPEGLEYGGSYWIVRTREFRIVTYIQRGW